MRLKRLVASVSAGFEDFVAKVENHEAVADCMIDDLRHATARVRVQHARVQSQIERLERQHSELDSDEARWNERALSLSETDEPKALECIRRARQAVTRRCAIAEQRHRHRALADDLKARLEDLEQRLSELQLKRTALSARSARAQTIKRTRTDGCESVDAVFDRWETSVVLDEYLEELGPEGADALEREFRQHEDTAELKARLDELKVRGGER